MLKINDFSENINNVKVDIDINVEEELKINEEILSESKISYIVNGNLLSSRKVGK